MKLVLTSLIALTLAFPAFAAKEEYSCTSSFGKNDPIQGYALSVVKEEDGTYAGTLFPICLVCMVQPTYFTFDKKLGEGGMNEIYTGADGTLDIALESLVPTRSHPAVLTSRLLNNGKPVSFTCTAQ